MKTTHSLVLILMLVVAGAAAAQEEPAWQLVYFGFGDETATSEINGIIGSGYMPVGLEVKPDESLAVLFVRQGSREIESWGILDYDDWNALEGEITGGIQDGFVPMDISRYRDKLAVLWVKTTVEIEGWRISTSPNTIGDRTSTINEFQDQGFTLWGASIHDGLIWYLFLRTPGTPPAGAVSGYERDTEALRAGMTNASSNGWLPNGLASAGSTVYICYVR